MNTSNGGLNTEKYIYNNTYGLWYELNGDYYIPCLTIPESEQLPIGVWGRKHLQYIKEHWPVLYNNLLLSSRLYSYLAEIYTQATTRFDIIVKQLTEAQGITAQLKAQNQMTWVGTMNNIRSCTEDILLQELIYEEVSV